MLMMAFGQEALQVEVQLQLKNSPQSLMVAQIDVFGQPQLQVKLQHIYLWQLQLQAEMEALGQVQ